MNSVAILFLKADKPKLAAQWAKAAADLSDAKAMRILGVIHHRSFADLATAEYWYSQAAIHGDTVSTQLIEQDGPTAPTSNGSPGEHRESPPPNL